MTIAPASFAGAVDVAPPSAAPRHACRWLYSSVMVLQDGTVTMCGADWDAQAPLGSVRDASLAEIWRGAELRRRRRAHEDGRFGDVGVCGSCEDWRLADGHGYVNALAEIDAARRGA
jgi:radical SAM protein with 4Fe4S-binding SPASM domain